MDIRHGYFQCKGDPSTWKYHIKKILENSPSVYMLMALAVGSLMREYYDIPSCVVFVNNKSTTGKTVTTKMLMSLRTDPQNITWCFDSLSTLNIFVHEAHNMYLCLDDSQHAIIPDKTNLSRHISDGFIEKILDDKNLSTTLFLTSIKPSNVKHQNFKYFKDLDLFPESETLCSWWMDEHLIELYRHYGHAVSLMPHNATMKKLLEGKSAFEQLFIVGDAWITEIFFENIPHAHSKKAKSLLLG